MASNHACPHDMHSAARENAACGHFQPSSYNVLSYLIRVCSWFDCPRTSLHRHPRNVTASAHSIHGRTEYLLYRSPHAVPAHIHYTASRTGVSTAPQPSHQRRSGGAHGVAVEPCGTARHAQRNPRACRLSRKVAHLRVLALYHGSSVCLQNAVQFFFFDLRVFIKE